MKLNEALKRIEELEAENSRLSASLETKNAESETATTALQEFKETTAEAMAELLKSAGTIIWNGPVGVFEFDQFGEGTRVIAEAIADSEGFSIAGGGDTLAAVDKYDIADKVSYISTGGGAFLEYVEGKVLPAVAVLEARASTWIIHIELTTELAASPQPSGSYFEW